jgi:hypothetical protein
MNAGRNKLVYPLLALYTVLAVLCSPCAAQVATGTVVGLVTDATGAVVPSARVEVRSLETGALAAQNVTPDGLYRFPLLTVGNYEMTVEAPGFKKLVQANIVLAGEQVLRIDAHLEVGDTTTSVTVKTSAERVDTESAALNTTVDNRRVSDLPLDGRNAEQLVLLTPGAVETPIGAYEGSFTFPGRFAAPVNGSRQNMINFTLDGSDANENYTNVGGPIPNPDVLEEIDITTNSFDARYGKRGGGVVNIITKSGTNSLHGSAFEFLRNQELNATNVFTNKLDGLKRNQFGFALGGPVVLPRLYNGKNHAFFLVSYQGTRVRSAPTSAFAIVPTAEERNGDFSAVGTPIIDPKTGLQFPNNQIPLDRQSAFAKNIFNYLPVPQPLPGQPLGALFYTQPSQNDLNEWTIKFDQLIGSKLRLSERYFIDDYKKPPVFADNNILTVQGSDKSRYQSLAVNATLTVTPHLLNQTIFSFDRTSRSGDPPPDSPFSPNAMGVNIYQSRDPAQVYFSVGSLFYADTGTHFTSPRNTYQVANNLTYGRGRHQLMFGGNVTRHDFTLTNEFIVNGYWDYNGSLSGDPLSDLFLGRPDFWEQGGGQNIDMRGNLYGFYAQDDFKVNPRLTLNLGLRWEPYWPLHDTLGRGGQWRAGVQSTRFPLAPKGFVYPGDAGVDMGLQRPDTNNFAPRVGFAFDPFGGGKTSVRGGYGVFYDFPSLKSYIGFGQVPPFSIQIQLFDVPSDTDPLSVAGNPFPSPPPSPTTPIPRPVSTFLQDPNRRTSYMQSWNLTVERELIPEFIVRAGYVGSKGTKLEAANEVNPGIFIPGQSTQANTDNRRPYFSEGLGSVVAFLTDAKSNYHGLQTGIDWRPKSRLSLKANYVFSKSIDNIPVQNGTSPAYINPFNENAYRGPSDFDARHRFVLSYIWDLPTPSVGSRPIEYILGHWSTAGIWSVQSGSPLTIQAGQNRDLAGVGSGGFGEVANVVGNPKLPNPSISQWFSPSAFVLPPLGSFGNAGRGIVYGPGFWNLDIAGFRDFPLTREGTKVQFRGDFFNAFNHVNPGNPMTNLSSGDSFGKIFSYRGPRIIQLALKVIF